MGLVRMTAAVSPPPMVNVVWSNVPSPHVPPATASGVSSVWVTTAPKGIASVGDTASPSLFTVSVPRPASYPSPAGRSSEP